MTKWIYWDKIINMIEQRRTIRLLTNAKMMIEGLKEGEAILKDISVTGCRVECPANLEVKLNAQYKLEIVPESSAKIGSFGLLAESRWIKTSANSFEAGFLILESPKGEQFQNYVDYFSWRYSQENSAGGEKSGNTHPFG